MGSSLSVTPFAVDDSEIEEVLDLRTGEYHRLDLLIGNDYQAAVQLRLGYPHFDHPRRAKFRLCAVWHSRLLGMPAGTPQVVFSTINVDRDTLV